MYGNPADFDTVGRSFLRSAAAPLRSWRLPPPAPANDNQLEHLAEPADGAQRERDELTRLATDAMFLAADMLEIAIEAGSRSGDPRLGETIELAQTLMRWGATRTAATAANRSRR